MPRTSPRTSESLPPHALTATCLQRGDAPARPQDQRIDWVDYAKGICILLVVMMHSTLGVEKAADATGWMGYVVEFSRPFRMPDFFVLSGLFLGLVIARNWRRYLDRKVVHFFYFYVLWVTIQFAFKAPGWMADGLTPTMAAAGLPALESLPLTALLGEYAYSFIQPFGTLWFIYMLPVFFVVTRLLQGLPWMLVLAGAALLEALPIHTGWLMIDEFAARYVYFLIGYMLAARIFDLADWVRANRGFSLLILPAWATVNALVVFAPTGGFAGVHSFADLPVLSLALGCAGAFAIIAASVLISRLPWAGWLEYCGRNSIVIYLAFFLPMAVSRAILMKFAPFLDIGTVSALVMVVAAAGPVVLYMIVQWTGYGKFLFHRPQWAHIDRKSSTTRAALHPAE